VLLPRIRLCELLVLTVNLSAVSSVRQLLALQILSCFVVAASMPKSLQFCDPLRSMLFEVFCFSASLFAYNKSPMSYTVCIARAAMHQAGRFTTRSESRPSEQISSISDQIRIQMFSNVLPGAR